MRQGSYSRMEIDNHARLNDIPLVRSSVVIASTFLSISAALGEKV